ncbi:MAG: hypothetical protein ABI882_14720 [Acidobacteriota bacterium]
MITFATSKRITVVIAFVALSGAILVIARPIRVTGKVMSTRTKMPISDVLLFIDSSYPTAYTGVENYLRTDSSGQFTARAEGNIMAAAWKAGYAVAVYELGSTMKWWRRDIIIELRELAPGHLVVENHFREDFGNGNGFSFRLGGVVSVHNPDADIRLSIDAKSNVAVLEALGEGGIIFQPEARGIDFYNTPEAPDAGYVKQWRIDPKTLGHYFIRTRDGKHFAKLRLVRVPTPHITYWPHFAYQSDGSRNLEIAVGTDYPFPFEQFGLKRESLK